MKTLTIVAALGLLCLPIASVPTLAATAHNSQAGAMGSTSNNEGPTVMSMHKKRMSGHQMKHMKKM